MRAFRFLTPALLTQEALSDIAGTGQARYQHFTAQVEAFHTAWKQYFNPRIARRAIVSCNDFAQFPQYSFHEESLGQVVRRAVVPLGGIGLLVTLIALLSFAAYRRFYLTPQ